MPPCIAAQVPVTLRNQNLKDRKQMFPKRSSASVHFTSSLELPAGFATQCARIVVPRELPDGEGHIEGLFRWH